MILSPRTPSSVVRAKTRFPTTLHNRSDAFARGAVVLLPSLDSGWLDGRARPLFLIAALAVVAILALLVAGAAHLNGQRNRRNGALDDEELFTTTPLPMPKEELARLANHAPQHAFRALELPRWLQVGSVIAALAFTWVVAQRMQPGNRTSRGNNDTVRSTVRASSAQTTRDDPSDSPEDLDLASDSSPGFAFRVRDWVTSGRGCTGLLEVTKGEPRSWSLTARVHDGQGQLIDTARARVATLREGDVVEFKFPNAACDSIGAWDVRGAPHD
jgi:hypothetical protein